MYVKYFIKWQANYDGHTDWCGVEATTIVEKEVEGDIEQVKKSVITESPVLLDRDGEWRGESAILTYGPKDDKEGLGIGNYVAIFTGISGR